MPLNRCIFGLGLLTLSCSGLQRVPRSLTASLPYEARIELMESENELAVAIDKVDQVRAEIQRTRVQIRRAREQLSAAKSDAPDDNTENAQALSEAAIQEAETRLEWHRARQALNVLDKARAEAELTCAAARFEESKARIVQKARIDGSEDLILDEFKEQALQCKETLADAAPELDAARQDAEAAHQEWEKARDSLNTQSSTARASTFVE